MSDERVVEIVEVQWLDSVGGSEWETLEDARKEAAEDSMLHRSVGWLIADEPGYLVLALSRRESWSWVDHTLQIPRGAIVRTKVLRRGQGAPA